MRNTCKNWLCDVLRWGQLYSCIQRVYVMCDESKMHWKISTEWKRNTWVQHNILMEHCELIAWHTDESKSVWKWMNTFCNLIHSMFELYGWIKNKYLKLTRVLLISKRIFEFLNRLVLKTSIEKTTIDIICVCRWTHEWL